MQTKIEVIGEDTDPKIQAVLTAIQGGQASPAAAAKPAAPAPAAKPAAKPAAPAKKIDTGEVELDEFGDPIDNGGAAAEEEVPTLDRLKELAVEKKAHKTKIVGKLKELGSDSVTNLAAEHYGAMFTFLNTLK